MELSGEKRDTNCELKGDKKFWNSTLFSLKFPVMQ